MTNQIIKEALHPYPEDLVIVTKIGARRGNDKSWIPALSPKEITEGVHDNLRNLGLETLDVVNLRVGGLSAPTDGSIAEPLTVLAGLKEQGLIQHLGLSNVSPTQLVEARKITEIACIQNFYNVAHRVDDDFVRDLSAQGIALCAFFPARRIHTAAIVPDGCCRKSAWCNADAGRASVATPALSEHPAHLGDIVGSTSARKSGRG